MINTKYIVMLILLGLLSCKQHQPKLPKKLGFLIGDWMMCNDGDKPNTNLCVTLTFGSSNKGSLRTVKSIDIPFSWSLQNNILTLKSFENQKVESDLIGKVYKMDTIPAMDGYGPRLMDTNSHKTYFLLKQ